ncbi:MAG: hypothetical protein FJW30_11320 [Acidobacteria bacterium]|nr:hypothetical protein [Acidobacteriota bacterium]
MTGILAIGGNHFIVRGPEPSNEQARALARHWTVVQIGAAPKPEFDAWRISTKEFREDLVWACVMEDPEPNSPAVAVLLAEMKDRGVEIRRVALV